VLPCTFCAGEVARRQGARRQARHCRGPAAESAVGSLDSATEGPLLVLAYRQSLWMQSIPISSHPYPTNEVCADRTVTLTGYFAYARFLTSWSLVAKEARGRMGSSQVPLPAPVFPAHPVSTTRMCPTVWAKSRLRWCGCESSLVRHYSLCSAKLVSWERSLRHVTQ